MINKKSILFVITSLNTGGAERVLVDTLNRLAHEKMEYKYTILTVYSDGLLEKELDKKIEVKHFFNISKPSRIGMKIIGLILRCKRLKSILIKRQINLDDYDKVIAYIEGTPVNICKDFKNKKISFIHTDISKHFKNKNKIKILDEYLNYEKIVCISEGIKKDFIDFLPEKYKHLEKRTKVIYNYIDVNRIKKLSREGLCNKEKEEYFLVIARLRKEKGVLRLLDVFKNRKEKLVIIGDGPLYEEMKNIINKENIKNIHLLGNMKNPYTYLKHARALIIPSYYEGYSMVAKEAEILNKFVISTKTNVEEALRNYKYKIIDDNLENGISEFINKKENDYLEDIKENSESRVEKEFNKNIEDFKNEIYS